MSHVRARSVLSLLALISAAPFLMGTGCEPIRGPYVQSDTGIVVSITDRDNYVADVPPHVLSARVFVEVDDGESTSPTTLTSLNPDLLTVEAADGGFFLNLISAGEAEVRIENECAHLGGCEATFVVPILSPNVVRWVGEFVLTRGGWGRAGVIFDYEAGITEGEENMSSPDGWVAAGDRTVMLQAPETGGAIEVEINIGDEVHFLPLEVVDLDHIFDFQLFCRSAGCEVKVEDIDGVRIEGAPFQWTMDGAALPIPEMAAGVWWAGDGLANDCELCVSVEGTTHERCEMVACEGAVER